MFRNKSRDSVVKWGGGTRERIPTHWTSSSLESSNERKCCVRGGVCIQFPKRLNPSRFRISFKEFPSRAAASNEFKKKKKNLYRYKHTWPQKGFILLIRGVVTTKSVKKSSIVVTTDINSFWLVRVIIIRLSMWYSILPVDARARALAPWFY